MDGEQKIEFFQKLVELGFKEIEISFPSSGRTDYDFTTELIASGLVPEDVWLQSLSPCRKDLILETVASLTGAKRAILHLYLATSPCFQEVVLGLDRARSIDLAVECTAYARQLTETESCASTQWALEFSPETFNDSDPDFVLEICEAVRSAWGPATKERPIIFNLPATVEISTPNVYADQIEYFSRHIGQRETVCVSVHTHNDRGCAVAAAELALLAGADRIEGTLFGNGERTGNVDLVTLALNLYTEGVHPNLDLSELDSSVALVERMTQIPVHPRAPYAGKLVSCAFSGSHQDAIKKGFRRREILPHGPWKVPYLPIDPHDIGRDYQAVIRINSQSGKGGIAWSLRESMGIDLPRGLQVAFAQLVQRRADAIKRELRRQEIDTLFREAYHLDQNLLVKLQDHRVQHQVMGGDGKLQWTAEVTVDVGGCHHRLTGTGEAMMPCLLDAVRQLSSSLSVVEYEEQESTRRSGEDGPATVAAFVACSVPSLPNPAWGVGLSDNGATASLLALMSAMANFDRDCTI